MTVIFINDGDFLNDGDFYIFLYSKMRFLKGKRFKKGAKNILFFNGSDLNNDDFINGDDFWVFEDFYLWRIAF